MNDKYEDNDNQFPDDDFETGLDFIELKSEFPGRHSTASTGGKDAVDIDNLPSFPTTEEEWEAFKSDKSDTDESGKHRLDYFETAEEEEPPKQPLVLGLRAGIHKDIPDKMDTSHPEGDYKPWEIIINQKTGSVYGFSKGEFKKWQSEQDETQIGIKCDSCGKDVYDNPFTGFKACPYCGARMTVLADSLKQVLKLQSEAMRFARNNAPAKKGFMTRPLDIPRVLLKSLATPNFEYSFSNLRSLLEPLSALFIFLIVLIYFVNLVDTPLFSQIALLVMLIAITMNVIAIKRSIGVFKIKLASDGITFFKIRSSQTIRYSRIISIRLSTELSLDGSLKKRNKFLVILLAPLVFVIYTLTLGLFNLYDIFLDPDGESDDDADYTQVVTIKTRGLNIKFPVSPGLMPDLSRLLGILIYMSTIESPRITINPLAYFASQK